mgnify:FL=1
MVGCQITCCRIGSGCLCRIFRRKRTSRVIDENGGFRIGYFLNPRTASIVKISSDDIRVRVLRRRKDAQISYDRLLIIAIERETSALCVLDQIAVKVIDIALPGREQIVRLIYRRLGYVVCRQLCAPDDLIKASQNDHSRRFASSSGLYPFFRRLL